MTTVVPERAPVAATSAAPPATQPRTWLRRIFTGGQIIESCPEWCTDSHFNDDSGNLDDLNHGAQFDGPQLAVFDAEQGQLPMPILAGRINVDPYSEDPRRNTPHIHLEPFQDEVMECLTPDEFAAVIAQVRAHCDRLDEIHTELVRIRTEHH